MRRHKRVCANRRPVRPFVTRADPAYAGSRRSGNADGGGAPPRFGSGGHLPHSDVDANPVPCWECSTRAVSVTIGAGRSRRISSTGGQLRIGICDSKTELFAGRYSPAADPVQRRSQWQSRGVGWVVGETAGVGSEWTLPTVGSQPRVSGHSSRRPISITGRRLLCRSSTLTRSIVVYVGLLGAAGMGGGGWGLLMESRLAVRSTEIGVTMPCMESILVRSRR